jgi:branched-chain amino acid transport system substrate-binding protein
MKHLFSTLAATAIAAVTSHGAIAQETLKVGVLQSYSGMTSLGGTHTDLAIKLFQQKYGETPGGFKLQLIRRDTTGPNPEVAKRLVGEVVTRERVQILIGPDFTPNTLAAAPILTEAKVPSFVTGAATTGIVGERSPYSARTFFATPQLCKPLAPYAVKQGWTKIFVIVADFAPGHECEKFFMAALKEANGTLVGNLRTPLSNPEYSGYIQRIRDAKPDGVFIFMPLGELSIGIVRAINDSGLKATGLKIMGTGDITDEGYVDAVGDAALGVITSGIYSTQHKSALNEEFVKGFTQLGEGKHRVGWSAVSAWDAMRIMYDALEAQKGQKFDPDKFKAFVYGHKFESPRGPVQIDKSNGDIVQNVYIRRVERINGVLHNVEIETIPDVAFK